jgi:anaerobic magnesium-protoporphyrin IX monomethyl ester cyclase
MRRVNKVLLLYPPTTIGKKHSAKMHALPLGVASIASILKNDYQVSVLDATMEGYQQDVTVEQNSKFMRFGLSFEEIQSRIMAFAPDFVGISCLLSLQYPTVEKICQDIKKINKNIYVAIGGPHPSSLARRIMENDRNVDFVVIGEGEYSMRELLAAINQGEGFCAIDGLAFRKDDKVFLNPKTKFIEDLDEIPFPDRELFPLEKYKSMFSFWGLYHKGKSFASLLTSRGCSAGCIYCQSSLHWGSRFRARSVQNVLKEMEGLLENNINVFYFADDNLTQDTGRAKTLFREIIRQRLDISWIAPHGMSVWTLDDEMISLMKESGCLEVTFGIESGNQDVLSKIIKKPLDLKHVEKIVKAAKKNKINTNAFFVFGFPGETKEDIRQTVAFARRLNLDRAFFFSATPFPGTELHKICLEKGYIQPDYDAVYNEIFSPKFETPEFTKKYLEKILSRCYMFKMLTDFLFRPLSFVSIWGPVIKSKLSNLFKRKYRRNP